ncbi:MAG: methyltransferase domain-containing protein [Bacteroidota bacterium]
MKDVHGIAIYDYLCQRFDGKLTLHNNFGTPDEMPVEAFFRDEDELDELEVIALEQCRGRILDVGAGAGALSIILQHRGQQVTAIEHSTGCIHTMRKRGIANVIEADLNQHEERYDTLLMMMNGLGLAARLALLPSFLTHCKKLLSPGGQIIVDSSDISYLSRDQTQTDSYFGEVSYQYEYRGEKSDWFDWLYVDPQTMKKMAEQLGVDLKILAENKHDQYLMKIQFPS